MSRMIFLLFVISFPFYAQAQDDREYQVPDYVSINEMTGDVNSAFYYPQLLKRYRENDTTLTLREYRMLYYGFSQQREYLPLMGLTEEDDSLRVIFAKDSFNETDLASILKFSRCYTDRFPFDLKKLNLVYISAKELGEKTIASAYLDKVNKLALTIIASGDGLTKETAFHIISIGDEYALINMLGYETAGENHFEGNNFTYMPLQNNDDHIPGLFFDAKPVFGSTIQAMK